MAISDNDLVRLRPHHLLCMLTFRGKGYSPAFVKNMAAIIRRLRVGCVVKIVAGPDDICAPRLKNEAEHHCHDRGILHRDALALQSLAPYFPEGVRLGLEFNMTPALWRRLEHGFALGEIRLACKNCQWQSFCDEIAAKELKS